ncbi:MAG: nucleotidyltransferase [Actinomycetota bacterium]|nr:nucleotidyltransferase [Actinomycetota bacterium]
MARSVDQGFAEFLTRLTPTEAQRAAGARHRATISAAITSRLSVTRIFETGSFSHGTGIRGHSDIDALVSCKADRPASSYTSLTWLQEALSARFPSTPVSIRRPAVQVRFGGGFETWEVIPGFLTGRGGSGQFVYDIPSPTTGGGWIDTAPEVHLNYVNEANEKPTHGDAKALARLLKAWKYYREVPVSSFYLEMRAAQHVRAQTTYIHVWDLCQVLEKLDSNQLAAMHDPTRAAGRIYACSSDATLETSRSKTHRAATRARNALEAHRAGRVEDAFYYLDQLFAGQFPAR